MKRRIKGLFTLFFTLTAITLAALMLSVGASAESKIQYEITYGDDGAATMKVTPSAERNYITFTTDGSQPTYTSELFPASLTVRNEALSLRLAEFNIDNEYLWGIKLTLKPKVTKVNIKEEFYSNLTYVTLSCDTEDAKIYYTLDGSEPTTSSKRFFAGDLISVKETSYLRAMAVKSGYKNSNIIKKKILVKGYIDSPTNEFKDQDDDAIIPGTKIKCSAAYHAESAVTYISLAPQKSSNKIYYTTDGSQPTKKSKLYKGRLKFTSLKTIRAIEYTPTGKVAATLKYDVKLRCKEVVMTAIDIADGTSVVKLSCPTEDTTIYYTINGKTPTTKSQKYTEPFMIGQTTKLKAIAVREGYVNSAVNYQIGVDIPIDLTGFNYQEQKFVDIVDEVNALLKWNGKKTLVHDKKASRAAQRRAIELKVRMSDIRPNGLNWSSILSDDKVYMSRGFEIIGKNEPVENLINRLIKHEFIKEFVFESIGVGYYECDGDYYWVIIVMD